MPQSKPVVLPSAAVAITVRILAGSTEDLSVDNLRPGQRRWWIQRTDGSDRPWIDIGRNPGGEPCEFTADLIPGGKYLVGTGTTTRVRFEAPSVPCTMGVDPGTGTAKVVTGKPSLSVVGADVGPGPSSTVFHVRNAPIGTAPRGMTYETMGQAFEALSTLADSHQQEITSGRIAVTRGPWPVASYPPPAPPVVAAPVSPLADPAWVAACADADSPLVDEPTPTTILRETIEAAARARALATVPPVSEPSAPSFTWDAAEYETSDVAVDRIREDDRYLRDLGLVMPPPVVQLGGAMNSVGRENIRLSHVEWSAEPRTIDTLDTIVRTVKSEQRTDITTTVGAVWMESDGAIVRPSAVQDGPGVPLRDLASTDYAKGGLFLESTALRELVALHPSTLPRAGQVMAVLPAKVRATVWNSQNQGRSLDDIVLRTRDAGNGKRSAFAVVSTGYTACDADVVADTTRRALARVQGGDTARGEAHYDPESTRLTVDAIWHSDHVVNMSAGDVFKMGVRVESSDNATGAVRVRLVAWRNLCYNLIITSETAATLARVVHRGTQADMVRRLADGIEHVMSAAAPFVRRWGHVRATPIDSLLVESSGSRDLDLRAIFREIAGGKVDPTDTLPTVRKGAVPALSESVGDKEAFIAACLRSYAVEPNGTLADVLNAMTGLHRERVALPVLRAAEEQAGKLLTAWS